MKKILRVLPFLIVLLLVYGLQVKGDVENKFMPFTEPFGRETQVGTMTINRAPQVLGDNRYAFVQGEELIIAKIDPATRQVSEERRPVPNADIYSQTTFRLQGDMIYWLGKDQGVKQARWENGHWSGEKVIAAKSKAIHVEQAAGKTLLFTGSGSELKVLDVSGDEVKEVAHYAFVRPVAIGGSQSADGRVHIGVVDSTASELYELHYLTFDPAQMKGGPAMMVRGVSLPSGSQIYESAFGIDKSNAYYLLTKASKSGSRVMQIFAMPLGQPGPAQEVPFQKHATSELDLTSSYLAYAAPGQSVNLPFVFVANTTKNPRVSGDEVFVSHLQGGAWNPEQVQKVTNTRQATLNPVFDRQGDEMTVVFSTQSFFDQFEVHYTSTNKDYAAATNVLTRDDYLEGMMSVPRYIGFSLISLFMAVAWPVLSYLYLLYFVLSNEDSLYDHVNRHLLIAVVLYLAAQAYLFLSFGKFNNFDIYAPEWMQSGMAVIFILFVMGLFSYLCAYLFGKSRYERNALAEFSYFFALNVWTALLGFSYFLAI